MPINYINLSQFYTGRTYRSTTVNSKPKWQLFFPFHAPIYNQPNAYLVHLYFTWSMCHVGIETQRFKEKRINFIPIQWRNLYMRKHVSSWILFLFLISSFSLSRPSITLGCVCGMRWFIYSSSERESARVVNGGKKYSIQMNVLYIWKSNECIFCYHDKNDEFSRISLFADAHLRMELALSNQPRLKQIDSKKICSFSSVSRWYFSFLFLCCKISQNPDDINEWKGFDSSAYSIFCAFFSCSLLHFTSLHFLFCDFNLMRTVRVHKMQMKIL